MGVSVHASRHRNSPYGQAIRRYIYGTRLLKNPHLPILRYKQPPQGPALWTRYMEYWPVTARTYATSTSRSTVPAHLPTSQFLRALCWRVKRRHIYNASAIIVIDISVLDTVSDSNWLDLLFTTWFDSPFPSWFDLQFFIWFDFRFLIRFDSTFFQFNLTHV